MVKQAARRKPGAKRQVAWPGTAGANDSTAPAARARDGALTTTGASRTRKRNARGAAIDVERDAAAAMAEALTAGFRTAAQTAIRDAHAEGFAVPARRDGIAVEIRPNGEAVPIDENAFWTPAAWRKATTR